MKKIIISVGMASAIFVFGAKGASAQPQTADQPVITVPQTFEAQTAQKHPMSVNNRLLRQQRRINQGIKSGELTRSEAKNLEMREANIATDAKIDRAENEGALTPAERRNLEHRENRQSVRIYNKKHNARTQ